MHRVQLAEQSATIAVSGVGRVTDEVCWACLEAVAMAAKAQSAEGPVESIAASIIVHTENTTAQAVGALEERV